MFCPGCGSQDQQSTQFCRACGTDLRIVRTALERPDAVTASAVSARDEIGRAVAAKIRETQSARDLKKVAEDVLPEIEKFLESPEEKRLRRIRAGVIVASAGFGAMLLLILMGLTSQKDAMLLAGAGAAFFVGLGIVINGLMFTLPRKQVPDLSPDARIQRGIDQSTIVTGALPVEIASADRPALSASVTEHTTHRLAGNPAISQSDYLKRD